MKIKFIIRILIFTVVSAFIFYWINSYRENYLLRQIIERLSADSRIAEVLVTKVKTDPASQKTYTTIKFLEYDTKQQPLEPRYFTFSGSIIQFQSLVIRFDDFYVHKAHPLKGKSAYIFMKVFSLADKGVEVYDINKINEIPSGYAVGRAKNIFQKKLWEHFWEYALQQKEAKKLGVKNAQIEAPGTKFIFGILYIIKIEHDGGMRIDTQALPQILKGERIQ